MDCESDDDDGVGEKKRRLYLLSQVLLQQLQHPASIWRIGDTVYYLSSCDLYDWKENINLSTYFPFFSFSS
tara:strand:- start:541 stop:753 length:213 start_codon:yes stop_codon:yes gene_type:complete